MTACDTSITAPSASSGISGPNIPGFGSGFSLPSNFNFKVPSGMPEDLIALFNNFQLILPSGIVKPALSSSFVKGALDVVLKLMDNFMPFLMMYKFFLPLLNIILCIIECICAIPNPFKLISAITKLFTQCIPAFLALFPIFALILMIISLLQLLLALITYIIEQLLALITVLLRNIIILENAFQTHNEVSILAVVKKIGLILCAFQNLFAVLSLFAVIVEVIKDIISKSFPIPPCDNNSGSDCCTSDVCPVIVQSQYTNTNGTLQYLNQVQASDSTLPPPLNTFSNIIRAESWQMYDTNQTITQAFLNIVDGYDVPINKELSPPYYKPIFFPTDVVYTNQTAPQQAAYTIDLRFQYTPSSFGNIGPTKYIRFNNCIVIRAPTNQLINYNNSETMVSNGVLYLTGGLGYEDDGITILLDSNGKQASLNSFIHLPVESSLSPILNATDTINFTNLQYTFKPNLPILLSKDLITAGCEPTIALTKGFINSIFAGDIVVKTQILKNIKFPDINSTIICLNSALTALGNDLTPQGVADFQSATTGCLMALQSDATNALIATIDLGIDPCTSTMSLNTNTQFTTEKIIISVVLNERNGLPVANNIPTQVATTLEEKLSAHISFGNVTPFIYDGVGAFNATISSKVAGKGQVSVSYDNQIFCINNVNTLTHTLQSSNYEFIYTPASTILAEGNQSDGNQPRQD